MKNADMPAMPMVDEDGMPFNDIPNDLCTMGLTKREHFTALAMQGLLAAGTEKVHIVDAVEIADALLAALEEK